MWRSQEVRRKRREKSWVNVKHRDAVEYADLDPETIQMKKDVKGLFQMIDKDMSGVITKDELMDAYQNEPEVKAFVTDSVILRPLFMLENFEDAFMQLDKDAGGGVSFKEFWAFTQTEGDEKNVRGLFEAIDGDGNRNITKAELVDALQNDEEVIALANQCKTMRAMVEKGDWDAVFEKIDTDDAGTKGAGKIGFTEFWKFTKRCAAAAKADEMRAKAKNRQIGILKVRELERKVFTDRMVVHRSRADVGGSYTVGSWPTSDGATVLDLGESSKG